MSSSQLHPVSEISFPEPGGSARSDKREEGLSRECCLTPPSSVSSHLGEGSLSSLYVRMYVENSEFLVCLVRETPVRGTRRTGLGPPGRRRSSRRRRRRRPHRPYTPSPLSATTRTTSRHARVFNKPVKARLRICLPSTFVTLLVL